MVDNVGLTAIQPYWNTYDRTALHAGTYSASCIYRRNIGSWCGREIFQLSFRSLKEPSLRPIVRPFPELRHGALKGGYIPSTATVASSSMQKRTGTIGTPSISHRFRLNPGHAEKHLNPKIPMAAGVYFDPSIPNGGGGWPN